jgi:leucyl/phenylalanyl-tRNA--protein transferase
MFHARDGASLCAFAALALRLRQEGFVLIDSQARTENMERFGARDVPRPRYLEMLSRALEAGSSLRGSWGLLLPDFPDSRDYAAIMAGGAPC